jgi:hypothetical protein
MRSYDRVWSCRYVAVLIFRASRAGAAGLIQFFTIPLFLS